MKFSPKTAVSAVIAAAALSLTSCSNPTGYSYSNIGITVTAYCSDCPVIAYNPAGTQPPASGSILYQPQGGGQGGVYQLTAHVTNAPATNVTWAIYPSPNFTIPNPPPTGTSQPGPGGSSVGTFTTASSVNSTTAVGPSVFYTNGGTPIYTDAALQQAEALGIPQGDVLIVVSVPNDPTNPSSVVTFNQLIQIYNSTTTPTFYMVPQEPGTPSNTTSSVAQVARNTTFQFYGGVAGEQPCLTAAACTIGGTVYPLNTADNGVIWEVGQTAATASAVCNTPNATGQSAVQCPYGWISSTGLYTAPPTVPTNVSPLVNGQVVIVLASHFLPAFTKFANISVF